MFNRSSQFSIKGKNSFNHVHGDQTIIKLKTREVKRTEYDEFEYIKRGHVISVEDLGTVDWNWIWQNGEIVGRHKAQKMICTVKLVDRQSKYTAMIYEGEDARRLWEEDFRRFSRTHNLQLFGINRSAIPALIFHHELIPCAHFYTGSFWMHVYIQYLATNMGCWDYMLWMNTTSGVFFSGPDGPRTQFRHLIARAPIVVPSTIDMLKGDASIRFFSKYGRSVDNSVLECASDNHELTFLDDLFLRMAEDHRSEDANHPDRSSAMPRYLRGLWWNPPDHLPINVIGGLRFDTVYSPSLEAVARPREARPLWWWREMDGLVDRTELDGGLIRFELDPVQGEHVDLKAGYNWQRFWEEWLSQSLQVFDALGVTEGKENFFIVEPPDLVLQSTQRLTTPPTLHNAEHPIEETLPTPIYLFVHSLPTTLSELVSWMERPRYFWSFDETGQSRLSEEECERWSLPVLVPNTGYLDQVELYSWPTHVYTALRDWQKARGFDPTTSDWARSRGHPEWESIGTEDRFVLVEEPLAEDLDWEVLDV
ncbi:hypothetical protein Moror_12109 [Moniliophthora roreri MCA 2997]|uniref:Uncharacterized protein n=1 Tax=Moniliophthora roreri (strain MCA 2997) TaxID=1381753 RepID=V2XPC4_MONRO|nr:hypothetical protein Moror_12109 [Moniliophthora roreri MCA 2997]